MQGRYAEAAASLRAAIVTSEPNGAPSMVPATAALFLGDDETALLGFQRVIRSLRERSEIGGLVHALSMAAGIDLWRGRFAQGVTSATEGLALARETHQEGETSGMLALLALGEAPLGQEESCRAHALEALEIATRHGMALNAANFLWALGRLELACGRPAEALTALRQIQGDGDLRTRSSRCRARGPRRGRRRTGERGAAHDAAERFEAWADAAGSTWTRAMRASVRALLADGDEADQHYLEAIRVSESRAVPFETARLRLLFGEHLRRTRRRLGSREQIRPTLMVFDAVGTAPFADRARAELRAAGEGARRATRADRSTMAALTPQERQVALHASEGATNKEIAALLFISRRTVEHHLTHAFDKLGVRSRVELVRTLADGGGIGDTSRP